MIVVSHDHFEQVIVLAREEMTLEDFWLCLEVSGNPLDGVGTRMGHDHVHEKKGVEPARRAADEGGVGVDNPPVPQLLQPLLYPGARYLEPPSQRRCAGPGVAL